MLGIKVEPRLGIIDFYEPTMFLGQKSKCAVLECSLESLDLRRQRMHILALFVPLVCHAVDDGSDVFPSTMSEGPNRSCLICQEQPAIVLGATYLAFSVQRSFRFPRFRSCELSLRFKLATWGNVLE